MKKEIFLVFAFIAATFAHSFGENFYRRVFNQEWETYKLKHNKKYTPQEDSLRMKTYLNSKLIIANHNKKYYSGTETYLMDVNKFADMYSFERERYNGFKYDSTKEDNAPIIAFSKDETYSESVDWRTKGAVSPVQDQGNCGSCWAFSAVGSLEGQHFLKTGQMVKLSEQNLVDCVKLCDGCKGGGMNNAFQYIKKNDGIDTEESYPYIAADELCEFQNDTVGATDTGYISVQESTEDLLKAVDTIGPISVAVDATILWQFYKEGVLRCNGPTILNHGVVVVGYGTSSERENYWIVKNSWGTDWGMDGYIQVSRDAHSDCGITKQASYPLV